MKDHVALLRLERSGATDFTHDLLFSRFFEEHHSLSGRLQFVEGIRIIKNDANKVVLFLVSSRVHKPESGLLIEVAIFFPSNVAFLSSLWTKLAEIL